MRRLQKQNTSRILFWLCGLILSFAVRHAFAGQPGEDCTLDYKSKPNIIAAFEKANGGKPLKSTDANDDWKAGVHFQEVVGNVGFSFVPDTVDKSDTVLVKIDTLQDNLLTKLKVMTGVPDHDLGTLQWFIKKPNQAYLCMSKTSDPNKPRLFIRFMGMMSGDINVNPPAVVGARPQLAGPASINVGDSKYPLDITNSVQ